MSFLSSINPLNILGSVGSSALDVVGNLISTKYANDLNMKNWHAQMDYNSPVNQLKRLREAGLNPNLIYGSGGVQNTITAAPKMDAPDGRLDLLSSYQQILNGEKQRELMDSQISKNEAEEDSALIHSVGMILDNIGKGLENDYREYELAYLKNNKTIRGQNVVNGVLDRLTNYVLSPVGSLLGLGIGNAVGMKQRILDNLGNAFKNHPFFYFAKKGKDVGARLFNYMYDRATSQRFGGRYY